MKVRPPGPRHRVRRLFPGSPAHFALERSYLKSYLKILNLNRVVEENIDVISIQQQTMVEVVTNKDIACEACSTCPYPSLKSTLKHLDRGRVLAE